MSEQTDNFAPRIVHVTGDDGMLWTDNHAGGFQSQLGTVSAIVALGGGMGIGIDVERVIGASLHARFAADAARRVKVYDAILTLIEGLCGADGNAGSVITVVAAIDKEVTTGVGKLAFLDVFDPGAVDADRHVVFRLTRDGAGMATDTLALVDDKGIFRHEYSSFSSLNKGITLDDSVREKYALV
jgi:hypothetical protein